MLNLSLRNSILILNFNSKCPQEDPLYMSYAEIMGKSCGEEEEEGEEEGGGEGGGEGEEGNSSIHVSNIHLNHFFIMIMKIHNY